MALRKDPDGFKTRQLISYVFLFLSCYTLNVFCAVDPTLPALGRPAILGEFYDARNQSFLGVTIFRNEIDPAKLIKSMDTTQSDIKYGIVSSSKSKLFHLDVKAEIKVEMMSGKLTVAGSAAYFNEEKKSALEVEGFLQYKTRTKREVLNLLYDDMKGHLKLETLDKIEATHIVIGIEYGADVIIKFLDKVDNKEDQTKIQGSLEVAFKAEKISISASASAQLEEGATDKFSNFTISVYGDINLGSTMLQNTKDVMEFINKVPEKLRENNQGKGVPMVYTLFPLSTLAKLVSNERLQQKIVNDLDEAILNDFIKMFDKISRVQQDLNDLEAKVRYYSNCTSGEDIARVETLNSKFYDASLQFKLAARQAMDTARVMRPKKSDTDSTVAENSVPNASVAETPAETAVEAVAAEAPAETPLTENAEETPAEDTAVAERSAEAVEDDTPLDLETRDTSGYEETPQDLMRKVLVEYSKSEYSAEKVAAKIETDFESILYKIELYKVFQAAGVEYFGRFGSFNNLRLKTSDKILYAIFMIQTEGTEFDNNWELFLNQLRRPFSHIAVVDCAFKDSICASIRENGKKTVMRQYYRANMISDDVFRDLQANKVNVERPPLLVYAVGRIQNIGDLYNSKIQQFTGKSIILAETNITKLNLTIEDFSNETIEITKNDFVEKFQVMNLQPPGLQYNILLNPRGYQGVGRTFAEVRGFQPLWLSKTLYHDYNTVAESILDAEAESFDFISIARLLKGGATHFVRRIVYGGQTTISLSAPIPRNLESTNQSLELMPEVRRDLLKLWDLLLAKSKEDPNSSNFSKSQGQGDQRLSKIPLSRSDYEIKFASDIFQNSRNEFRTERDLVEFLNEFPRLKRKTNGGKGRPVLFELFPIANLQQYFGVIPHIPAVPIDLVNTTLSLESARIVEALNEAEGNIDVLRNFFKEHERFLTDETLDEFHRIERLFKAMKDQFYNRIRGFVAEKNEENLAAWLVALKSNSAAQSFFNMSGSTIKFVALEKFSPSIRKIHFFTHFLKEFPDVKYNGHDRLLLGAVEDQDVSPEDFVFVLLYKTELVEQKSDSWIDNLNLFHNHLTGKKYNKLLVVDCDFEDPACAGTDEASAIHLYKNQELITNDVFKEWTEARQRLDERKVIPLERKSIGRYVQLGDLYSAKSESFTGTSILNKQLAFRSGAATTLPPIFKDVPQFQRSVTKTISSSDLQTRFDMLELKPEVQLALLFDDEMNKKLEGSGEFLEKSNEFFKAVSFSIQFNSVLLSLESPELPQYFLPSSISSSPDPEHGPTHFVKEIRLGSNTIVSLGKSAVDTDVQFLEKKFGLFGAVQAETALVKRRKRLLKRREVAVNGTERSGTDTSLPTNLELLGDFTIFSDLPQNNKVQPIKSGNFQELVDLFYRKAIDSSASGFSVRGSPSVSVILEPLESLKQPLGIIFPSNFPEYHAFPKNLQTQSIIQFFEQVTRSLQHIQDLEQKISKTFTFGMTDAALLGIEELRTNLTNSFTNFKDEMKDVLQGLKNGSAAVPEVEETLQKFKLLLSPDGLPAALQSQDWRDIKAKLKFLKRIKSKIESTKTKYLGRNSNFEEVILNSLRGAPKYLLYIPKWTNFDENLENSTLVWMKTLENFFQYLVIPENDCFIVDCDFPQHDQYCKDIDLLKIHQYVDGKLKTSDYIISETNKTEQEASEERVLLNSIKDQVTVLNQSFSDEQVVLNDIRTKVNQNSNQLYKYQEDINGLLESNRTLNQELTLVRQNAGVLEEKLTQRADDLDTLQKGQLSFNDKFTEVSVQYQHLQSDMMTNEFNLWSKMTMLESGGGKCGGSLVTLSSISSSANVRCDLPLVDLHVGNVSLQETAVRADPYIWMIHLVTGTKISVPFKVADKQLDAISFHSYRKESATVQSLPETSGENYLDVDRAFPFGLLIFSPQGNSSTATSALSDTTNTPPTAQFEGFQLRLKAAESGDTGSNIVTFDSDLQSYRTDRSLKFPLLSEQYVNNERRIFVIRPLPGRRVRLMFLSFETENFHDYVSIFAWSPLNKTSTYMDTLTGNYANVRPKIYQKGGNDEVLILYFHSDPSNVATGFICRYDSF